MARQTGFRVGDEVLVLAGRTEPPLFYRAEVVHAPGRAPDMRALTIRFSDGRVTDTRVVNCHRRSPEFDAWSANLLEHARLAARLIELCQTQGFVFGGPACQKLPEWAHYKAAGDNLSLTGDAAFAVHPYGVR